MKKLTLMVGAMMAITAVSYGQGLVNWQSISAAAMTAQTNATTYSSLFGGGSAGGATGATASASTAGGNNGYYYELLYSTYSGSQAAQPSSLAAFSSWTTTGLQASNSVTAGRLTVFANQSSASAAVPWAAGVTNNIMLVGWSANLGATWSAALSTLQNAGSLAAVVGNAFFGTSSTGYVSPAASPAPGITIFSTSSQAYGLPISSLNTQLYLVPVPEPSTIALAGLGGLGLLALRRRNK